MDKEKLSFSDIHTGYKRNFGLFGKVIYPIP